VLGSDIAVAAGGAAGTCSRSAAAADVEKGGEEGEGENMMISRAGGDTEVCNRYLKQLSR
jgi:hypothetical protein